MLGGGGGGDLKFCIQNAKFCKLRRQILQKFCNVFTKPSLISFSAMQILQWYTRKALSFSN